MNNKYYTPDISEFYIGFEYEELFKQEWSKMIRPPKDLPYEWVKLKLDTSHSISRITSKIKQNKVRVKYLDFEDVKKCGFKHINTYINNVSTDFVFEKQMEDYKIFIRLLFDSDRSGETLDRILIMKSKPKLDDYCETIFDGYIKNISELKKILTMIGVDYESK